MIMKAVRWVYWNIRRVFFSQAGYLYRCPVFLCKMHFLIIYLLVCKFVL